MAIDFDAFSAVFTPSSAVVTCPHTIGANDNRFLFAYLLTIGGTAADDVVSATYGAQNLSFIDKVQGVGSAISEWNYVYGLIAPPVGTDNITFVLGELKSGLLICGQSYFGVAQEIPTIFGQDAVSGVSIAVSLNSVVDQSWQIAFTRSFDEPQTIPPPPIARFAGGTITGADYGPLSPGAHAIESDFTADFAAQVAAVFAPFVVPPSGAVVRARRRRAHAFSRWSNRIPS